MSIKITCEICNNNFDTNNIRGVVSAKESAIYLTSPKEAYRNNPLEHTKHICCECLVSKFGWSNEEKKESEITQ